jgi:hypothetical protein
MTPAVGRGAAAARRTPDLLRLPGLGRLLRWRYARLVFQVPLLLVAGLIVLDGFTGPGLAAENLATTLAWIHYRGLVVLALLLVGNLFCMGCPFMLPRRLGKWLLRPTRRWPRALQNKYLPLTGLLVVLWAYEAYSLWASPWLTAWVAVAYFVAALVIDGLFAHAAFCKHVCPLGLFNMLYGTVSPAKVTAVDVDVCRRCPGKDCLNGRPGVRGCELGLFVPAMATAHDCTLCLDCVHACPNDNIALALRPPASRLLPRRGAGGGVRWPLPARLDLAVLCVVAAGAALVNALAMVAPGQALEATAARLLGSRALGVGLGFAAGMVAAPLALAWTAAALARAWGAVRQPLRLVFARFAPAYIPLGLGFWTAHYAFHFLTGALTVVPIVQAFAARWGLAALGRPAWGLGQLVPTEWIFPLQAVILELGLIGAWVVAYRSATALAGARGLRALLPVAAALALLTLAAFWIFTQPMQMRGIVPVGG